VRRLARATAVLIAALALAPAGASAQGSAWEYYELGDGDALADAAVADRSGNGAWDDIWFDLDQDGAWDTNLYDVNGDDSFFEVLDYDFNENGRPEYRLRDADQRVGYDWVYLDRDEDGAWDRWRGSKRRIIPGSDLDAVTASNRRNASSRILADFSRRYGGSLLHPNLPAGY
jgi:hypothetical protein